MKKFLSIILSILMVMTMLPSFAFSAFAGDEPSFVGPNDSEHAYLDIHANGENYNFYYRGAMGGAKIDGACYDLATNTLTLDNYNEPSAIIEASEMGNDFKISVIGENHIKAITVLADKYMGSLTIVGDGSISINENKDYDDVPLYLDANNTGSILEVEDTVRLSVCANDDLDDIAVKVLNSLNENPIICANAEQRISSWEESSSYSRWINAHDTQTNTFFGIKDSENYTTSCYDNNINTEVNYEFTLVNKTIDGKDVVFANPTTDEMGNYKTVAEEDIEISRHVIACQIMEPYERAAVEKKNDDTEYTLTEYTLGEKGPFWDVHKVIHDDELGNFFYPVVVQLTEEPTEYTPVIETIDNNFKYIEYDFSNIKNEEPSDINFSFTANVRGSDITYHNEDNIYIEEGKTELICFDVFDDDDVQYVPTWYSKDMADQGFEIAPEPVVIDDIYYASITNNAKIGCSGTFIINAFSGEKFADPDFDFATTEPDATFELQIISVGQYAGVITVDGNQYAEGSTITMHPNETINMYYNVPNYTGFSIHTINPDPLTEAGFGFEQGFDDDTDGMPYAIISSDNVEVGTRVTIPLSIKRLEDCVINDFDFAITPSIYEYSVTINVVGDDENTPCEHKYNEGVVLKEPTCSAWGEKEVTCTICGEKCIINKDNFLDFDQNMWNGVFPLGHTMYKDLSETTIIKQPTCSSLGECTWNCKRCGEAQYDLIVKDLDKHNYKTTTPTKATTKADGKVVTKCADCGKISSTKTINKIGTVTLGTTKYTYDGKAKKPTVTVKDSKGNKISTSNYTVAYSNNTNVGKATVKITFKGNYSGTVTKTFTIVPKTTSISSLSAVSKGFTVKWKKQSTQTTGYDIQIATNSSFTKGVKNYTVSKNSTVSKKITSLTGKKKYFVRIRTYKTVSGTKYYSSWSASKYVTTKK